MSGRLRELVELVRRRPWRAGLAGLVAALILSSAWVWITLPDVSPLARGWPDTTAFMELRLRQAEEDDRSLDLRYRPVDLRRIPEHLQLAVRLAEDAGFYGHGGVDWVEVRSAVSRAWEEKRFPRGASTISQQLARNLYLSPSRTPWRKLREYFIARRLERELSKERILELYLSVIELGPGIFGVDAAARHYFGVPAGELSPDQSLQLVAAIPAPRTHNPATHTRRFRWRMEMIRGRVAAVTPGRQEIPADSLLPPMPESLMPPDTLIPPRPESVAPPETLILPQPESVAPSPAADTGRAGGGPGTPGRPEASGVSPLPQPSR